MTHRNVIRLFSGTMLAALVLGCGKDTPSGPAGVFLTVDPLFVGLDEGGAQQQFTATLGGQPAAVTWESSNTAVATVSATGLATSLIPGTAAITATSTSDATQKRSASVTVIKLTGTPLQNGVPITGLSGTANGTTQLFRLSVPAGRTSLTFATAGGTGDVDIFVNRGTPPTTATGGSVCDSQGPDTNEACTIPTPAAGTWYVLLVSFIYSGTSVTGTYVP
jgi:hypothetical protein